MPLNRMFSMVMVILSLSLISLLIPSYAAETKISLSPTKVEALPGDSFIVDVLVSDVSSLSSWQIALKYNGTIINCTSVWVPDVNVFAGKTCISVPAILNELTVDGFKYVLFGNSLLTESVDVSEGLLCRLNFSAQMYGVTPLLITTKESPARFGNYSSDICYSILLNPDLQEMPFAEESRTVEVGGRHILTLVASNGGTTNPPLGTYTYAYGKNVSVAAISDAYHVFDHWLLDGDNAGIANPVSVLMTQNHTLQPIFAAANFTLAISEGVGGTTNLSPGAHTFAAGETIQVTATPNGGYRFDHWILDGSSTLLDNPISVPMDNNHTLEAVFSEVYYTRTIYIRPNGAVDPTDVPISTLDNVTYTFTETIYDSIIVVQRSNIIIDGNGFVLQGAGSGEGFSLYGINNVTIRNTNIRGFDRGVCLFGSSSNIISDNNITGNKWLGIALYYSSNNTIIQNNLTANNDAGIRIEYSSNWNTIVGNNIAANKWLGIYIDSSSNNSIHHNNWVNNANQAYIADSSYESANFWDDGFEGNFWNNYSGIDSNCDGINDTPLILDENNVDHYPLAGTFHVFKTSVDCPVNVVSNSTIENFKYLEADRKISFNVKGVDGTTGYCRIIIEHKLIDVSRIQVMIDDGSTEVLRPNYNLDDNGTHRWIYFAYKNSVHNVVIQEDVTAPTILVSSPENKTYPVSNVTLIFTVNELTSWSSYSLDGTTNATIYGNTTLTNLLDGPHSVVVFANDTVGNMGLSNMVLFTVDATPPNITTVSQTPGSSNVSFDDTVEVSATVTDNVSKVKKVTLIYSCANCTGTWNGTVEMTNLEGNIWTGSIPALSCGTNVTYAIVAEDDIGHTATTLEACKYQVIPEFPSLLLLYLCMTTSLMVVIACRKRRESLFPNRQR
jgi:parallel beta-helix repeat protein